MCKTLHVLLPIWDSLNRAVYLDSQVLLKGWPEVQFAAGNSESRVLSPEQKLARLFSGLGTRVSGLVHRCGRHQVDLLPFALDNPGANLRGSLALLVFLIGVIKLLQTGRALSAVSILKAAVQAVVAHSIAVAIARLLMQDVGKIGRAS